MMQPRLPQAEQLLPYLHQIDTARVYSNWGTLCSQLQRRLSDRLGTPEREVVCANSGSSALSAAVLAHAGAAASHRRLAVLPSYTFTATAMSVLACGYDILLLDVEADDWMLSPERVWQQIQPWRDEVGVVVPVVAYGRAYDHAAWEDFQREYGMAVVVDAAASFEWFWSGAPNGLAAGSVPVVVSFHATKTFSTAEGGGFVSQCHCRSVHRCFKLWFLRNARKHPGRIQWKNE